MPLPRFCGYSAQTRTVPLRKVVFFSLSMKCNPQVSWIRTKDLHILTSAAHTFSADSRFEAAHSGGSRNFWGLRLRGAKEDDSGRYECQVNTDPKISLAINLTVTGKICANVCIIRFWLGCI